MTNPNYPGDTFEIEVRKSCLYITRPDQPDAQIGTDMTPSAIRETIASLESGALVIRPPKVAQRPALPPERPASMGWYWSRAGRKMHYFPPGSRIAVCGVRERNGARRPAPTYPCAHCAKAPR